MQQQDYCRILGVETHASAEQIKEAYRRLAFKYHPDRNRANPEASEKMKAINEAYAVLSNPAKRRQYEALRDQFGSSAHSQFRRRYSEEDIFRGSDINDILEEMAKVFGFRGYEDVFREFYGEACRAFEFKKPGFLGKGFVFAGYRGDLGQDQRQLPPEGQLGKLSRFFLEKIGGIDLPQNGSDIFDVIKLSPQHAQKGGPFTYFVRRKSKKLILEIPPRVKEGQRIRLVGMGEDGRGGGKAGDLYLKVHMKKPLLQRMRGFLSERHK